MAEEPSIGKWKKHRAKRAADHKAYMDAQEKRLIEIDSLSEKLLTMDLKDPNYTATLSRLADLQRQDPESARLVSDRLAITAGERNQRKYVPVLKTILAGAGVGAALQQISQANVARRNLVRPGIPVPPAIDPGINQQIFNAQMGSMDAGRYASAANVGINDAYNQAVQEATNTASGQAGIRQSLINKANLNKMRASAGMLPALDNIRSREESRADALIANRAQLGQNSYGQLLQGTGMALDQYNRDADAIGKLGAIGHENLFGQLQSMPENLVASMSQYSNPYSPKYSKSQADTSGYDSVNSYDNYTKKDIHGFSLASPNGSD